MTAGDSADLLVDRNVTADIERRRILSFIEKLELRIKKDKLRLVPIEVHPAKQHDSTPGAELSRLKIASVEPLGVNEAAAIGQDDIKNPAARSRLDNAAAVDARMNGRILADPQRRKGNEIGSVLIGLGKVKKQLPGGSDVSRDEKSRSTRADALHILHVGIKPQHVAPPGLGIVLLSKPRACALG